MLSQKLEQRYQGAKIWNDINDDIKLLPLKKFKKKIKANIIASHKYILNVCKSVCNYSLTSRKRPPKMSSLGDRLQEVIAYQSLDHV